MKSTYLADQSNRFHCNQLFYLVSSLKTSVSTLCLACRYKLKLNQTKSKGKDNRMWNNVLLKHINLTSLNKLRGIWVDRIINVKVELVYHLIFHGHQLIMHLDMSVLSIKLTLCFYFEVSFV